MMIAVLTADVVNSRSVDANRWLPVLKRSLNQFGTTPKEWEIFRGDNFQLKIDPVNAITASLSIKAALKQVDQLDIRVAIGIGPLDYDAPVISESNGVVFEYSGHCFEQIGKRRLAIRTPWNAFNEAMNLYFDLAALTTDKWTPVSAQVVETALRYPDANQTQVAKMLNKSQPTISETLNRAGFDELSRLNDYYQKLISRLIPVI